jgi:small conductance mechanosensitive channel
MAFLAVELKSAVEWNRIWIALAVVVAAGLIAKVVDMRMARRVLHPAAATRYRVLRRTVSIAIVAIGILSALLTIPQVQAVAGGVLASTAVLGLVIGLAAQRTLSNFVAGILIAISQPLRLGDLVTVDGETGRVEEIALSYTFIRLGDGARLVIPNEKLASDTIRNSTIRTVDTVAEIKVQVPLNQDVAAAVHALREEIGEYEDGDVVLTGLEGEATLTVRVPAPPGDAERLEHDLRLRAHTRLRAEGVFA